MPANWPDSWPRRPLPRPTCASPPCWRRLTGWASSTLPPATAPGWRPVRTACTSSALPKLRTRVPGLPPCRRRRWAGSSCPWAISAPRMWLRWQQNKKTKEMHPAFLKPVQETGCISFCSVLFHRTTPNGSHPLTLRRSGSSCGPTENWHRSCSQGTYTWRRGP